MILYQPSRNRSWKPLRGKALRLLIFNTSAVERQRFERKAVRPYPPALSLSRERAGPFWSRCPEDIQKHRSVLAEAVFCVRLTVH